MALRRGAKGEHSIATTPKENASLVQRFLADVVAGGDSDAAETFLAEDVVVHNLAFGDGPTGRATRVLDPSVLAAADVEIDIDDVVSAGDRVAVLATVTGTHRESLLDLVPTGEPFEIACAWFCRVDDERIAEVWSLPDGLGLVQQLGVFPEGP